MKNGSMQTGRFTAMLAAAACASWGTGVVHAQPSGGGGGQLPPPFFEPEVVFFPPTGGAYGIDSADFLKQDENGNWVPGQDGFPEIAVAGAGVLLFDYCDDPTGDHNIVIMRNTGDWENPVNGFDEGQMLGIPNGSQGSPNIRATELAFADVTGDNNGPDLVLLGYDSDTAIGYLLVYKNHGDGSFDDGVVILPSVFQVSGLSLRGLVAEDLDLDGDIDIVAAASNCFGTDKIVVFQNMTEENNQFGFAPRLPPIDLGITSGDAPGDIVAGDFFPFGGGQPLLDLVTPNTWSPSITKIANLGNLQFSPVNEDEALGCAFGWDFVTATAGLFGADVIWDFAAVRSYDVAISVFTGISAGQFENNCDWDVPNVPPPYKLYTQDQNDSDVLAAHGIASGDFNGGPNLDLVVAIRVDAAFSPGERLWNSSVAVLLGLADGTFQTPSEFEAYIFALDESGAALVEVVDLNADGFDDIVVTNHYSDSISVLINSMSVTQN